MSGHSGKAEIVFANEHLKESFCALMDKKGPEAWLYEPLVRALEEIENNPEAGIKIQKKLWPKEYIKKYEIDNLWKYDLPKGWRLVYTIARREIRVLAIVLEWFDHKGYERRFGY